MNKLKIMGLCLILLPLTACGLSGIPTEGQVLYDDTKTPAEGVYVTAKWQGYYYGGSHTCVHMESTITDIQGRYKTPGWSSDSKNGTRMESEVPSVYIYKPGYVEASHITSDGTRIYQQYKPGIGLLEIYKGTNEERMQSLVDLSNNLSCQGTDEKSLFQMQAAIYREARGLAISERDKDVVRSIKWNVIGNDNYLSEQLNDGSSQPEKEQPGVNGTILPSPEPRSIPIQRLLD